MVGDRQGTVFIAVVMNENVMKYHLWNLYKFVAIEVNGNANRHWDWIRRSVCNGHISLNNFYWDGVRIVVCNRYIALDLKR